MKLKEILEANKIKTNLFIIIGATIFLCLFNSLSYAYFTAKIEGEGKEMSLSTSDIIITFTDNETISKTGLTPGSTITKTFSVTNKGTSETEYKINWEYLINNFVNRDSLVYKVTSTNGGGTLSETQLPDTEEHISIIDDITIAGNTTQNYTMTITYKDSGQNQDEDKNKSLVGKIEITDIDGNSILPETSTGPKSEVTLEKTMYGITVKKTLDMMWPIGSVYISFDDTNPSERFGGVWQQTSSGTTLIGYKSNDTDFATVGQTGGVKSIDLAHSHTVNAHTHTTQNHTLTVAQMPAHSHLMGNWQLYACGTGCAANIDYGGGNKQVASNSVGGSQPHNHGDTGSASPGTNSQLSSAQSILNPYTAVYIWKRVS